MVFNKVNGETSEQNEEIVKKFLTCSEIEKGNNQEAIRSQSNSTNDLKHDSAVLVTSSKKLTRYDKAELRNMQNKVLSQQKPACFYDPRILRMNILKLEGPGDLERFQEDRIKMLQENLQTLALHNWNSTIYQNYKSYHYALLNPSNNCINRPSMQQPNAPDFNNSNNLANSNASNRRFDYEQQQQAALDKILTYDRKTVFFDTLTTTTTMRPPPPRMAYNNNNNNNNSSQQQMRRNNFQRSSRIAFENNNNNEYRKNSTFNNSYYNEKFPPQLPASSFAGSGCSTLTNLRSSFDESSEKNFSGISADGNKIEGDSNFTAKKFDNSKRFEGEGEPEPEWLNVPVTRQDFVDLKGFTEEDEASFKSQNAHNAVNTQSPNYGFNRKPHMPRFNNRNNSPAHQQFCQQHQQHQQPYMHKNSNYLYEMPNPHVPFFRSLHNNNNGGYQNNNNFSQRFRNPLHQVKSLSPKTPTIPSTANNFSDPFFAPSNNQANQQPPNPFYEAWKTGIAHPKNLNFVQLMQRANAQRQLPPSVKLMSEVEQRIIQNSQMPMGPVPNLQSNVNIRQFFENFSGGSFNNNNNNNIGGGFNANLHQQQQPQRMPDMHSLPTREQLQQHTSEILRNAILRNREHQHYHDETQQQ